MQRRDFLRALIGTCCAAGALTLDSPWRPSFRIAQAATGKTLVVIFQRGGCDGLNTVVPYGDDDYYQLRPTIAIAPPRAGDSEAAINLNGFFGLHPGLAALAPIYQEGAMAILPTVHYPDATRSHFDSQTLIESGALTKYPDGWLNRHLSTQPVDATLRAASFGHTLTHALRGVEVVSSFNSLTTFTFGLAVEEETALVERLTQVYGQIPDLSRVYHQDVYDFGKTAVRDLSVINSIDPSQYSPANGAVYPDSSYGQQLQQTAQLIKAGVGLEVAALNIGGWDTHRNQGSGNVDGRQFQRFQEFAKGIAAFYTDLGGRMNDVVILTMTEFGRTAAENGSKGTDHGNASTWFVIGKSVQGGIYGVWPGLRTEQLYLGRYLKHNIDFRNVFGEVLTQHLGNTSLNLVFPGYAYQPVGFL